MEASIIKDFFRLRRYNGLVDLILDYLLFENKILILKTNRTFANLIKNKYKYLKVHRTII